MAETVPQPPRATVARPRSVRVLNVTVVVCALGYFVDVFDLLLFSIVRVPSLVALGVPVEAQLSTGVFLLNVQMAGLLLGGLVWGILGDKRGRLSVLFGSIALYSIANLANAFVTTIPQYAVLRFLAGVGLAGELGAAITLVSEVMPKETRGYGTAIVAGVGVLGAVVAGLVGRYLDWQVAYIIGGVLGLILLAARVAVAESGMYRRAADAREVKRGDLRLLLGSRERAGRLLRCVLIGVPLWFAIGVIVTFSPELSREIGVRGAVAAGMSVVWAYAGLAVGDLASGFLSQRLATRRWILFAFINFTALAIFAILFSRGLSPASFYGLCFLLGIAAGYWAVFVTNAAEQFGTNLRSTVTTTVPNFVRGSVVPITLAFQALAPATGLVRSALIVGVACVLLALLALRGLQETHGRDLDFVEV